MILFARDIINESLVVIHPIGGSQFLQFEESIPPRDPDERLFFEIECDPERG
jgi:hypothetical protein